MRAMVRQHPVILPMSILVLLAWSLLWLGGQSPYGRYLTHGNLHHGNSFAGIITLGVTVGWLLMIIAMMLPASLPLVAMFDGMTRHRADHASLVALLTAGYLGSWTFFGLLAHVGDGLLHHAIGQFAWVQANAWAMGASILVLAGLYQFTALKSYCLEKCRSPLGFLLAHWGESHNLAGAFRLGIRHGLLCIGCCWLLMLLMFVVGLGNLGWMFILGALMAIEKGHSWGRRLTAPLGITLIAWGGWEAIVALS